MAAHRGAAATHPENTLAALRRAAELGAHQVELDVRATADGALVLMHDASVDRTTDGSGRVDELTLEELRRLDAGSWKHPRFRGERVPTLAEAFRALPRDLWINVHVKGGPELAEAAARVVVEEGRVAQALLAVDGEGAGRARRVHPGLWILSMDRGLTRGGYVARAAEDGADFVQLLGLRGRPGSDALRRARGAGLRVNFCCLRDPQDLEALFRAGVDFPLVDDLEPALDEARRLGIPTTRRP